MNFDNVFAKERSLESHQICLGTQTHVCVPGHTLQNTSTIPETPKWGAASSLDFNQVFTLISQTLRGVGLSKYVKKSSIPKTEC